MKKTRVLIITLSLMFILAIGLGMTTPASAWAASETVMAAAAAPALPDSPEEEISGAIWLHGIRVDHLPYLEVYRLHIPLARKQSSVSRIRFHNASHFQGETASRGEITLRDQLIGGSRSVQEMLVMIRFESDQVRNALGGRAMVLLVRTNINLPQRRSSHTWVITAEQLRLYFLQDLDITLSNNMWQRLRHLPESAFLNATATIMVNQRAYPLYVSGGNGFRFDIPGVRVGTTQVPPSHFDPDSPDFDLDEGNTGTNVAPLRRGRPTLPTATAVYGQG